MLWEAAAAGAVGLAVLWLVLQPLLGRAPVRPLPYEPLDPEETPRGIALSALREIEFDKETGKLSDEDYARLESQYTAAALAALRAEPAPGDHPPSFCGVCGAPTLPDARFCSVCGMALQAAAVQNTTG